MTCLAVRNKNKLTFGDQAKTSEAKLPLRNLFCALHSTVLLFEVTNFLTSFVPFNLWINCSDRLLHNLLYSPTCKKTEKSSVSTNLRTLVQNGGAWNSFNPPTPNFWILQVSLYCIRYDHLSSKDSIISSDSKEEMSTLCHNFLYNCTLKTKKIPHAQPTVWFNARLFRLVSLKVDSRRRFVASPFPWTPDFPSNVCFNGVLEELKDRVFAGNHQSDNFPYCHNIWFQSFSTHFFSFIVI